MAGDRNKPGSQIQIHIKSRNLKKDSDYLRFVKSFASITFILLIVIFNEKKSHT